MTDIEKRISELERKMKVNDSTEEIEAERVLIKKAEKEAQERLRGIARRLNEACEAHSRP